MNVEKIFGTRVFDDSAMKKRLPQKVYQSLLRTRRLGQPLDPQIADVVACAMKEWALEQGATHYSHWFQPMNNFTAGKHDAFLTTNGGQGEIAMEFSSKALIQGEADSSSFPSGGLRATFEARGYTTWDPTSPAFVRDGTLFIPTAFCSYNGEALDAKTPLLRSMKQLSRQGVRLLHALGKTDVSRITPMVGAEQEYFLVDYKLYDQRLDLKICGRTLFGAKPSKGQELDDHYCGRLRIRVGEFMQDLDKNLWEMGVGSKTKHNEAAPAQHELAPEYSTANIACDHNQLIMETMRTLSKKHGLACLLHEKQLLALHRHRGKSAATGQKSREQSAVFADAVRLYPRSGPICGSAADVGCLCRKRPPSGWRRSTAADHLHFPGKSSDGYPQPHCTGERPGKGQPRGDGHWSGRDPQCHPR